MTRCAVLGAGIVGLWTAYILTEHGFEVEIVSAAAPDQTTSAAAVCVLTPFFPESPEDPTFARGVRWAKETLAKFTDVNTMANALELMPCYEFGYQGYLEASFPVSKLDHLDFSNFDIVKLSDVVADCDFAVSFTCTMANTRVFLAWIHQHLRERSVKFTRRKLTSPHDLDDIKAEVIFNCLGFNQVFPDPDAYPVHGQSMFVPADNTGLDTFGLGAGHHAVFTHTRGFYLGSFFMPGATQTPSRELYESSVEFVKGPYRELCASVGKNVPSIDLSRIDRVNAGVRPFRRAGPRVEVSLEYNTPVVHNNGHGAHGWTVGYGSSLAAVRLFTENIWSQ